MSENKITFWKVFGYTIAVLLAMSLFTALAFVLIVLTLIFMAAMLAP